MISGDVRSCTKDSFKGSPSSRSSRFSSRTRSSREALSRISLTLRPVLKTFQTQTETITYEDFRMAPNHPDPLAYLSQDKNHKWKCTDGQCQQSFLHFVVSQSNLSPIPLFGVSTELVLVEKNAVRHLYRDHFEGIKVPQELSSFRCRYCTFASTTASVSVCVRSFHRRSVILTCMLANLKVHSSAPGAVPQSQVAQAEHSRRV